MRLQKQKLDKLSNQALNNLIDFRFSILQTYLSYFFKIIYLNTFSELLNFVYISPKLNILSNYAEHPKKLVLCCWNRSKKLLKICKID